MNQATIKRRKMCRKKNGFVRTLCQVVLNAIILVLLFLMLYPLMLTLFNAFKNEVRYEISPWYPMFPLKLSNVVSAFSQIWQYLLNTLIVAIVGGTGLLFIAAISAYTFARMQFFGRKLMFGLVISLMMIPSVLTLFPLLELYKSFNLTNSLMTLIMPLWTSGPIFGTFLLHTFFRGLPKDIFEAAKMDGANEFVLFYKVAVPLCLPIIGTLAIMTLVNIWNDYLWPMTTIQDLSKMTISAGLKRIADKASTAPASMTISFAGYLVAAIPLLIVFVFANRYYIEGLTGSAIKM